MKHDSDDWEARIAAVWKAAPSMEEAALRVAVFALADERAADDAAALFEKACACDSTGLEAEAENLYRAALASDQLDAYRRSRASIQLGSTLRLLGRLQESEALLLAELDRHMQAGNARALHDEARAILALTYVEQGRAKEAAGLALCTLAPHLSRYTRSVKGNASAWATKTWD